MYRKGWIYFEYENSSRGPCILDCAMTGGLESISIVVYYITHSHHPAVIDTFRHENAASCARFSFSQHHV